MRPVALALGAIGVLWAGYASLQGGRATTLIITGDLKGHLEPCGCTSPMSGGIKRAASVVRQLQQTSDVVLLSNGAMSGGTGPQDVLKLQALAEAWGALSVSAINLSADDARMSGRLSDIDFFSHGKLLSGSIEAKPSVPIHATVTDGPVMIGGVSSHPETLATTLGTTAEREEVTVQKLLNDAADASLMPVLLLDGPVDEAERLAKEFPKLALIVYRSAGDAPTSALQVGGTTLVTPGEQGKSIVSLTVDGDHVASYRSISLGPTISDDPQVSRIYRDYLGRVDKAGFLDHWPRKHTGAFVGSLSCGSCHKADLKIWEHSKHSRAFASLETEGHARDPDCVSCHVVGLSSTNGFRSRLQTPALADVGCESCHGPGALHSHNPKRISLPKVGLQMCAQCHTSEQSPNFKASPFWTRILHR